MIQAHSDFSRLRQLIFEQHLYGLVECTDEKFRFWLQVRLSTPRSWGQAHSNNDCDTSPCIMALAGGSARGTGACGKGGAAAVDLGGAVGPATRRLRPRRAAAARSRRRHRRAPWSGRGCRGRLRVRLAAAAAHEGEAECVEPGAGAERPGGGLPCQGVPGAAAVMIGAPTRQQGAFSRWGLYARHSLFPAVRRRKSRYCRASQCKAYG